MAFTSTAASKYEGKPSLLRSTLQVNVGWVIFLRLLMRQFTGECRPNGRHGHKVDGGLYYLDFMGENYLFHKLYVASSL